MWNYSGNIATVGNFSQKSTQLNAIGKQHSSHSVSTDHKGSLPYCTQQASINQHAQSKATSPYQEQQTTISLVILGQTFLLKIFFHLKAKKHLAQSSKSSILSSLSF